MKKKLQKKIKLTTLLFGLSIFLLTMTNTTVNAQQYKYLKLYVDNYNGQEDGPSKSIQLGKIRWKMGDKQFPLTELNSIEPGPEIGKFSSNPEVRLEASYITSTRPAYKVFENDNFGTYFNHIISPGVQPEYILEFLQAPLYPTGVILGQFSNYVTNFSCYGSNNGQTWTLLYTSPILNGADYTDTDGDGTNEYVADFGTSVPSSIDTQAPSTPSGISVGTTTSIAADISWTPSTDTGVGVLFYEIFVNDELWVTSFTSSATVYGLSKQSNYTVKVKAIDVYGNESILSSSTTINTEATYPEALRKMDIGTGIGHATTGSGVYKSDNGAIFSGNWQSNNAADGPFSTAFINEIKEYDYIRFMDLFKTNYNSIEDWNDRIQADNPKQFSVEIAKKPNKITNEDVLSYEWAIHLCNVTDRDIWLNIPAFANENYIRELAILFKNNLNPNLKVYIESGNETWNSGFFKETFNAYKALGANQGFGPNKDASYKYSAYKSIKMFEWFNEEFGNEERVINIHSGQVGGTSAGSSYLQVFRDPVLNPNGTMPELYSVAPYFLNIVYPRVNDDSYQVMKKSIDDIINTLEATSIQWNTEGIELITYEGGIHFSKPQVFTFNRDKAIYNAYLYYLDRISPYFKGYTNYTYVVGHKNQSGFGSVGLIGNPISESPKSKALLDWKEFNKNNPNGGVNSPPVIFIHPKDLTVNNGVNGDLSFLIAALSTPSDGYQWFKDNQIINGEINGELKLDFSNKVSLSDNGTQVHAVATNTNGTNTSTTATLTVLNHQLDLAKTSTAPTIDGTIDAMWSAISSQDINNVNKGVIANNSDLSGTFKTTWDDDNIYFLVQVTDDILVKDATGADDNRYNYDGVEFYINGNNTYAGSYDSNDGQFIYNWNGDVHKGSGSITANNFIVGQKNTANGYIMEVAMPWSDFGVTAQNEKFIGLDIMLNDNDIPESSVVQEKKSWHTLKNDSWTNPSEFASVQLNDGTPPTGNTLNITATNGTVTKSPDKASYDDGDVVQLTATAASGFEFTGWSGDASGSTSTLSVTMNSDKNITANFAPIGDTTYRYLKITYDDYTSLNTYDLDWLVGTNSVPATPMTSNTTDGMLISATGWGGSAYRSFDSNLNGGISHSGTSGKSITLDLGSNPAVLPTALQLHINSWATLNSFTAYGSNDGTNWDVLLNKTGANSEFVKIDGVNTKEATFDLAPVNSTGNTLNITATNGTVTKSPDKANYDDGDVVQLTATAASGFEFTGWSGDTSGSTNPLSITMNSDKNITANFTGGNDTTYRYLKITYNDYSSLNTYDLDWLVGTNSVPATPMTSNTTDGMQVSVTGWEGSPSVYKVFDANLNSGISHNGSEQSVTLDLGSNPAVSPTALQLHINSWATLNAFTAYGSNDGSNWDVLLNKTGANGEFIKIDGVNTKEATFNFSASKISKNKNIHTEIKVFPNPVSKYLNINIPAKREGTLTISLTSIAGKIIWKRELSSSDNQIDVSSLATGLYVLELRDNVNLYQYKIIKQ